MCTAMQSYGGHVPVAVLYGGGDGVGEVVGTPEVVGRDDGLGAGPVYRTTNIHTTHVYVNCI